MQFMKAYLSKSGKSYFQSYEEHVNFIIMLFQ